LDSLLSGPTNLNLFGSGLTNKTSRLYRALVDTQYAVNIGGVLHPTIDPYLYTLHAIVHPAHRPEETLAALDAEIARLQDAPPSADELQRALKQARALFAYGSESISNQAFWMGYSAMFAEYAWYTAFLDRLAAVTPADVQRVARTYLRPQNRVVGVYRPIL
jgi:zinc protease